MARNRFIVIPNNKPYPKREYSLESLVRPGAVFENACGYLAYVEFVGPYGKVVQFELDIAGVKALHTCKSVADFVKDLKEGGFSYVGNPNERLA